MFLKYTVLLMSGVGLCLMIMSAGAQTADEDRQAVIADQQTLNNAYRQLLVDERAGNAAGIQIDKDNINTAEQNFRTDEQRMIADDQNVLAADQQLLDELTQQLQQDRITNTGAVAADETGITAAQQKLKADRQQIIADDELEITRDKQAVDNENMRLQADLTGNPYVIGGPTDAIQTDKKNIQQAIMLLQQAQLKLQLDQDSQSQP